jgi:hypothetical protein
VCDVIELEESHEMRRNMKGMCMPKPNTFVRDDTLVRNNKIVDATDVIYILKKR